MYVCNTGLDCNECVGGCEANLETEGEYHGDICMDPIADYQKRVLNRLSDEGKIDIDQLTNLLFHKSKNLDELTYNEASLLIIEVGVLLK